MQLFKTSMLVRVGGTLLMAVGASLLSGGAAWAGGYGATASAATTANTSIIAMDGPVELSFWQGDGVKGVDSAGRTISVALLPSSAPAPSTMAIDYN